MLKKYLKIICVVILLSLMGLSVWLVDMLLCFINNWPVDSANENQLIELSISYGIFLVIIGLVAGIGAFFTCWGVVRFLFKNKNKAIPLVISVLVTISIIIFPLYFAIRAWHVDREQIVPIVLEISKLSNIPESAYGIKYGKGGNLFARTSLLKFYDSQESIEAFISKSEILRKLQVRKIESNDKNSENNKNYEDFTWFNPLDVLKGREFSYENDGWHIRLTIDDEHNIVYIYTSGD